MLLADDVGLGKTTVSALVAWVIACQDKRVRIYAPNEVLASCSGQRSSNATYACSGRSARAPTASPAREGVKAT